ncbi:hypothetical protein SAMD00019534_041520 [Acytostelium subglobosum LB1]|uniref:hypothetical protein n=1 Tax=Acytostelium subglobosum LB1 TaxID=1410327 RepID=UPI00064513C0|nr:hypothetical protein SAMD00019534_041520 [Acytostelium subglobosum LB1]GAM20977.1 hypothetical protein SAMD00019534_041520 [Acytostelium subglobosum LB1]|eukprot:XP_012756111.1 hypothetical protein SAMD00019534_041520 [Acytostelium subglobosum LB1]
MVLEDKRSMNIDIDINDIELMRLVQVSLKHMISAEYQHIPNCLVNVDHDMTSSIKDQLSSCFEIIDEAALCNHNKGRIISVGPESTMIYTPSNNVWSIIDETKLILLEALNSTYARGNIYSFGGPGDGPSTFIRFSLADGKWHGDKQQDILRYTGRLIDMFNYLGNLSRANDEESCPIDRFNLATLEFEESTKLSWTVPSCCFDGKNLLYLLSTGGMFRSVSLATRRETELASVPIEKVLTNNLCYGPQHQTIYLFQGRKQNYRNSIKHNVWTKLDDKDPIKSRNHHGIGVVLDDQI